MAGSDKRAQKQQRRKRRKAKASEPFVPAASDKFMSVDTGPSCFVYKLAGTRVVDGGKNLNAKFISYEDSIRPVPLKFDPPLQSCGTDPTCFDYQWQQLTYLFDLDDPFAFVKIFDALSPDDRDLLIRYIETCRALAGYSIINTKGSFSVPFNGGPARVDLPSHQEFSGFSATFRQLHNDGENASFVKVWNVINRALNDSGLEDEALTAARLTLKAWKQARARLSEKAAATMICEKLAPNLQDDHPRTLKGIVPADLIKNFNYGDTLHWGDQREQLAELTNDPFDADFHKFACMTTMNSLSHLYFGFAVLVAAALGAPGVR